MLDRALARENPLHQGPQGVPFDPDAALVREALRLYERYAIEVVERFDLCPWAAHARREGSTRARIFLQDSPLDLTPSLEAIEALAREPEIAVVFFIYPRLELDRLDFEHFLRRFRHADSERHPIGSIPFAMAAFHPEAPADLGDPDRLIPFIRRTPDPTLQLVRRDALDSVQARSRTGTAFADLWMLSPAGREREPGPSVRERITLKNFEMVRSAGADALEAVFRDIARDRADTYARIAANATHA